jgi:type I restriction enzyme S subunit
MDLPSVIEQRRIVAGLSEQLALASEVRELATICSGTTSLLRRRVVDETFENVRATCQDVGRLRDALQPRNEIIHPRDRPTGEAMFVGLEHIESDTGRRLGDARIHLEELTGRKARFHAGDIVYGYLRPYLNKVWLADTSGFCSVDQYVFKVDPSVADAEYLAQYIRSSHYLSIAPIKSTPGQLPRIRTEEVLDVAVPLPAIGEQIRIAATLRGQLTVLDAADSSIREMGTAVEALPTALLRRAFDGLTA